MIPANGEAASDDTEESLFAPRARERAADHVFKALARAILRGDLKAHEPLPTQRQLAKRFAISPLLVRQAVHRLEDLGLVRVRQGSPTIVLDPAESNDLRVLQLEIELAPPEGPEWKAALENCMLVGLPIMELAERRITPEQLDELDRLVNSLAEAPSVEHYDAFERQWWTLLATATGNNILTLQVRWWFHLMERVPKRVRFPRESFQDEVTVWREIVRALRHKQGASEMYLRVVRAGLDLLEQRPGSGPLTLESLGR